MAKAFDPSAWTNGVTIPHVIDFQNIATDLYTRGANVDGGGYGRPNTAFVTLPPGELPGVTYTVTAGSWGSGTATLTIGAHNIKVNQIVTISGVTPSGYNGSNVKIGTVTATTISYALPVNPGAWSSGGTALVGTTPGAGTVAVDAASAVRVFDGANWSTALVFTSAGYMTFIAGGQTSTQGVQGIYVNPNASNVQISCETNGGIEGGIMCHSNGNVYIGAWSNHPIKFRVSNSDVATLDGSGNFNIIGQLTAVGALFKPAAGTLTVNFQDGTPTSTGALTLSSSLFKIANNALPIEISANTNGGITKQIYLPTTGHVITRVPASAVTDTDLANGNVGVWYDEAGSKLTFRVRSSAGVLKTGTVTVA